jgi:hypothetical protein
LRTYSGSRALADEEARADALIGLAPHLTATDLLAALEAARTIEASRTFWMPDGVRAEVLDDLREAALGTTQVSGPGAGDGLTFLWDEAWVLGKELSQHHQSGEPLSAAVARWAELASGLPPTPGPAGARLMEQVRLRTEAGENGEAQAWLRAGKVLAEALQGDLATAVKDGEHALELAAWRARDLRQLRHFLERQDQIDEFERLVKSPRDQGWALHYIGLGGVGKTTLIRYITARRAPTMGMATARVDFDYLSPNYPGRRPGLLLLELADKLTWGGAATALGNPLTNLKVKIEELHAELDKHPDPADPLKHLKRERFGSALRAFTALLDSLGRMTVLILDTCEELTKLRPVGARLPNLEVTHEILRRVHDALPDRVRVVFAGRRLLAQAGAGWSVNPDTGPPGLAYLPSKLEYLRLHVIRGFRDDEVDTYFNRIERIRLEGPMRAAILKRSREAELAPAVSWQRDLRLMSSVRDTGDIPTAGKNLIIVAVVDHVLHFRTFDDQDKVGVDTDEEKLTAEARPIEELKEQLESLWPPHELTAGEAARVAAAVASLVDHEPRSNPYYLKLYADWLREEPDLPVEKVAAGETDPYVHIRVVERLKHQPDLQAALPAAVLLRRFDLAMIRAALAAGEEEELFRGLGDQEWIEYRVGDGRSPTFLEIPAHLYPRLLEYYQPSDPSKILDDDHRDRIKAFDEFRQRLAPALAELVRQTPLGELHVIRVDAALRVMDAGPAAVLWDELAFRIPREADWGWALNLTSALLGGDGAIRKADRPEDDHPLLASVLAVHIASLIHVQPDLDVSGRWTEVLAAVPRYPDESTRVWLTRRGRLGVIATLGWSGRLGADQVGPLREALEGSWPLPFEAPTLPGGQRVSGVFWRGWRGLPWPLPFEAATLPKQTWQLLASVGAALEAVLERVESGGDRDLLPDADRMQSWLTDWALAHPDAGLRAFARTLAGRVYALHGQREAAESLLRAAGREVGGPEPEDGQPWFDWRAPASLLDRVRLEVIRWFQATQPVGFPLEERLLYSQRLASRLDRIDSERLLSALIALQLDQDGLGASELEALARADRYDAGRQPVCAAHWVVPPLFVTLARGFLALGQGDRALQLIRDRADAARPQRDERTVDAANAAQLRTLCRLRLPEARSSLGECLNAPKSLDDARDIWPMKSLCFGTGDLGPSSRLNLYGGLRPDGEVGILLQIDAPPGWDPPTALHLWWRSQVALDRLGAAPVVEFMKARLVFAIEDARERGNVAAAASLILDKAEIALLEATELLPVPSTAPSPTLPNVRFGSAWMVDVQEVFREGSVSCRLEELARLKLRAWALLEAIRQPAPGDWAGPIPPRRQAEIALGEGELLALRMPERAVPMLDLAVNLFAAQDDHFRAWTAALLGVIAAIHAGNRGAALRRMSESVRPHYEAWLEHAGRGALPPGPSASGVPPIPGRAGSDVVRASPQGQGIVPDWSDLRGWRGVPESRWHDDSAVSSLRGWLDRLAACVTWYHDPTATGEHSRSIRARLERQYGQQLPIELALAAAQETWTDQVRELLRTLARGAWLLILWGTLFILVPLIAWDLARQGRGARTAGILVVVAGIFFLARVLYGVITRAAQGEVVIQIDREGGASELAGEGDAVRIHLTGEGGVVRASPWRSPGFRPYREAAREFPVHLATELRRPRWYPEAFRKKRRVWLALPWGSSSSLDSLPWEAYVIEAVRLGELAPWASWARRVLHAISPAIESRWFGLEFKRIQLYRGAEPGVGEPPIPVWSGGRVQVVGGRLWGEQIARVLVVQPRGVVEPRASRGRRDRSHQDPPPDRSGHAVGLALGVLDLRGSGRGFLP